MTILRSVVRPAVSSAVRSVLGSSVASAPSPGVATPSITAPADSATDIGETPTITSSAFAVTNEGSDTHLHSDWQVASDSGFSTIVVQSADDTTNKVSWAVPSGNLLVSTTYYVRCRHHGTTYGDGSWSATVSFTTAATFSTISALALSWIDPSNGASITGSSPITSIADQGSDGGTWNPTGSPTLDTVNGRDVISCASSRLEWSVTPDIAAVYDFFAVVKNTSDDTSGSVWRGTSTARQIGRLQSSSALDPFTGTTGANPTTYVDGVLKTTRDQLFDAMRLADGWVILRVDGVTMSNWTEIEINNSLGNLQIGAACIFDSTDVDASALSAINTELNAVITDLES